jgi:hypothetical protein
MNAQPEFEPVVQRRDYAKSVADQEPLMRFFGYAHLRAELQEVSKPFGELAMWICENIPRCDERTVALRKLLETKDCCVRARL